MSDASTLELVVKKEAAFRQADVSTCGELTSVKHCSGRSHVLSWPPSTYPYGIPTYIFGTLSAQGPSSS
eukprot:scaffold7247_cov143-Skeletonema_menzelii.AAC.11